MVRGWRRFGGGTGLALFRVCGVACMMGIYGVYWVLGHLLYSLCFSAVLVVLGMICQVLAFCICWRVFVGIA